MDLFDIYRGTILRVPFTHQHSGLWKGLPPATLQPPRKMHGGKADHRIYREFVEIHEMSWMRSTDMSYEPIVSQIFPKDAPTYSGYYSPIGVLWTLSEVPRERMPFTGVATIYLFAEEVVCKKDRLTLFEDQMNSRFWSD